MKRTGALLALAACVTAASLSPAAARPPVRDSWSPAKAKKACAGARAARARRRMARRLSCTRWRPASKRGTIVPLPGWSAPGGDPETDPGSSPPPLAHSVSVRAREFSLTLSRAAVAEGDVMVEFNTVNAEDPHDLKLRDQEGAEATLFGETEPELVPPPRQSFAFAAGDYVLFCSLPGHEDQGMRATLAVR